MRQIKINTNQAVWITSDLHLLHKNISGPKRSEWKDGFRDFEDEYKMTDIIINNINNIVASDDVLIFLGDFCFKDHKRIPELRNRINCQTIHFIRGNHDQHIDKYKDSFTTISDKLELNYNGNMFVCDHYAHRVWLGSHKGYYHCYGHCVDYDTEILTERGWLHRSELLLTDKCFSYNSSTKLGEFKEITKIHDHLYTGKMYRISGRVLDLRCTDNHKLLLGIPYSENTEFKSISELTSKVRVVFCAAKCEMEGINISDDLLKLYIWINSDGSFENTSLVRFHLKKVRKISYLKALLEKLNIKHSFNHSKTGTVRINFTLPLELSNLKFKPLDPILLKANFHQKNLIFQELINTDGYLASKVSMQIYTCREEEADIIQLLAVTNGYRSNKHTKYRKPNYKGWFVSVNFDKPISHINFKGEQQPKWDDVINEPVWCITTQHHNFMIRRNGKVHFTGNSHDSIDKHPNIPYGKSMDVGVDSAKRILGEYRPFNIKEVINILNKRDLKIVDHHNQNTNVR